MHSLRKTFLSAVVGTVLLSPSITKAATITENLSFTLKGFVDIGGASIAPPDPLITGSITVTYDPTLAYDNDTTGLVVHSLTGVTVSSQLGFTYVNGFLEFGGIQNHAYLTLPNTNDLVVGFNVTNPAKPTFTPCSTPGYNCGTYTGSSQVYAAGYTVAGYNTSWFYGVQSTVVPSLPTPGGAPEPSTIALLGAGILALGAYRYRASKKQI